MKKEQRLDIIVDKIINEHNNNNNEYFYYAIMLCMIKLTKLFIDKTCPLVQEAAMVAENFWINYIPYEGFPTLTISDEYKKLSKFIDKGKNGKQNYYARAVRLTVRKYSEKSLSDNTDIFPLFVDYLIKMGCYRETISNIIEGCFSFE